MSREAVGVAMARQSAERKARREEVRALRDEKRTQKNQARENKRLHAIEAAESMRRVNLMAAQALVRLSEADPPYEGVRIVRSVWFWWVRIAAWDIRDRLDYDYKLFVRRTPTVYRHAIDLWGNKGLFLKMKLRHYKAMDSNALKSLEDGVSNLGRPG